MSVETDPLSPAPLNTRPLNQDGGNKEKFEKTWARWFIELRTKINIINAMLVNFANLTGTGFPALDGDSWAIRQMQGGPGVDIANADGSTGNPTFSFNSNTALVPFIAGATYQNVQDIFDLLLSPGTITGGEVTVLNPTTVRVTAGTGIIRILDDNVSTLKFFNFAQADFPIAVVQSTRFYAVDYNAGVPIVVEATVDNWDRDTQIPLGSAFRFDGVLNTTPNPYRMGDVLTNLIQRLDAVSPVQKDNSVGGLGLGVLGVRNVTVGAGKLWARVSDFPHLAKNSAVDTMFTAYFNGASLTVASGVTQWDNLNFNNTGAGTLQVMGNNKWANLWFYVSFDGTKYGFVYGTDEYNSLGAASLEGEPFFLTQNFHNQMYLLGRFIFQKGAATPGSIENNESQGFVPSAVNDHNQLTGLQGGLPGTPGEFYHLTAAQYAALSSPVSYGRVLGAQAVRA